MANMREIRMRIKSIEETRQITRAMKLISVAKLKKARRQLEQTLPYFTKCSNPTLFVAGVIGRNYFVRNHFNVSKEFDYPVQNPTVYRARDIADNIVVQYITHELDEVYLIYTELISAIKMVTRHIKLLPLDLDELKEDIGFHQNDRIRIDDNMIYEPSPRAVCDVLIPKYLKGIIYGAMVEAFTSEQSARMAAMDNATTNADEMLQKLKLSYNRARQSAITQEISEIVGGTSVQQ